MEARENLFKGSSAGSVKEPFTWFYDPNFENSNKAAMVENSKRTDPLFGDRFATAKYDVGPLRKYELQGKLNYLPTASKLAKPILHLPIRRHQIIRNRSSSLFL